MYMGASVLCVHRLLSNKYYIQRSDYTEITRSLQIRTVLGNNSLIIIIITCVCVSLHERVHRYVLREYSPILTATLLHVCISRVCIYMYVYSICLRTTSRK